MIMVTLINEWTCTCTLLRESRYDRNFFIDKQKGGCGAQMGWLVVKDGNATVACEWEKQTTYPQFLYGQNGNVTRWNDKGTIHWLFKHPFLQNLYNFLDSNLIKYFP